MECSHLSENVKLTSLSIGHEMQSGWGCSVCKTSQSPWLCLFCGSVSCGRYESGHAKHHQEEKQPLHSVCMDCINYSVYCYLCDEFVINDTSAGSVDKIRNQLQALNRIVQHSAEENQADDSGSKENRKEKRRRSSELVNKGKHKKRRTGDASKVKPRTSGLRNLGNTCFMNAVLQSLSNIQSFCGYIKQLPSLEQKVEKKKHFTRRCKEGEDIFLVEELRKTLVSLWQGNKSAISPESLFSVIWKVVPRFRGYQQQDAHEFMRYLLDRLHTELLTLLPYPNASSPFIGPKGKSTIVTAIFGGLLQNEVTCLVCGIESKKHDPFLDLSLDVPTKFVSKTPAVKGGAETMSCDLNDCLSSFVELEELEETELYMCSTCKKKQRSTKKFWIRRLPNVLCLHLKRFRWSSQYRVKIDTCVEFPLRGLDMTRYMLSDLPETRTSYVSSNDYDLAAVIVHHGTGAGSGHYTSYAVYENQWYHFNDSSVTACDEGTVAKCKAYILFYVRRDFKLPESLNLKS